MALAVGSNLCHCNAALTLTGLPIAETEAAIYTVEIFILPNVLLPCRRIKQGKTFTRVILSHRSISWLELCTRSVVKSSPTRVSCGTTESDRLNLVWESFLIMTVSVWSRISSKAHSFESIRPSTTTFLPLNLIRKFIPVTSNCPFIPTAVPVKSIHGHDKTIYSASRGLPFIW